MAAISDDDAGKILDLPSASGRGDVGRIDDLRLREIVRFGRRWVPSAAAAVVIAGLLSWNLVLQQQLRSPGRAPAAGSVATGTLTDARKAPMGTITYVAQGQLALISLHSLHHPSAGRIYELWLIEANGHVQGAGLFTPEADGTKVLLISHLIGARDKIAVTEEPLAGSQAPTSALFISGHL